MTNSAHQALDTVLVGAQSGINGAVWFKIKMYWLLEVPRLEQESG